MVVYSTRPYFCLEELRLSQLVRGVGEDITPTTTQV
jgi:hypothetical protein